MTKFLDILACSIFVSVVLGCSYFLIQAFIDEPMFMWALVWGILILSLFWSGLRLQDMIRRRDA